MHQMTESNAITTYKAMLTGGFAAAAPGLVALVAAGSAARSTLADYTGMGGSGVMALGVLFFCLAYLLARGRWWAGLPALLCALWAMGVFVAKVVRLLAIYYQHNPIHSLMDITAPFAVISLPLCLVLIGLTLALAIFKAQRLARNIGPQPVHPVFWGAMGLWLMVIFWDGGQRWVG